MPLGGLPLPGVEEEDLGQQVMRLRVRLGPLRDCIEATRGAGYRLRVP